MPDTLQARDTSYACDAEFHSTSLPTFRSAHRDAEVPRDLKADVSTKSGLELPSRRP